MIKILIPVLFILTFSFQLNAQTQQASKIKPVKIVWIANQDTLDIEQAQRGIAMPDNLQIAVILDSKTIGKLHGQKFEFKWYMKNQTKVVITNSFFAEVNSGAPGNQAFTVSSGRGALRKGWWKVQVIAYTDMKQLSYSDKQEFWINLK